MRPTTEPSSALGLPRRSCWESGSSSMRSSSIASRSAAVTGVANGSTPASAASSRSSCAQKPWNVVTVSSSYGARDRGLDARAQLLGGVGEKVRHRISSGDVPSATSHAKRSTSTRVLPVPAPPTTSSGPPDG